MCPTPDFAFVLVRQYCHISLLSGHSHVPSRRPWFGTRQFLDGLHLPSFGSNARTTPNGLHDVRETPPPSRTSQGLEFAHQTGLGLIGEKRNRFRKTCPRNPQFLSICPRPEGSAFWRLSVFIPFSVDSLEKDNNRLEKLRPGKN